MKGRVDPLPIQPARWGAEVVPLRPTEWPLAVENQSGKGKSIYIAFDVGRFLIGSGTNHAASYMASMIDALALRQIEVKAPTCVEVTVRTQERPRRTIVHLANRSQSPADLSRINELISIHAIEVALPNPYPRSNVTCRGGRIRTRSDGARLYVTLNVLEDYSAIVIAAA